MRSGWLSFQRAAKLLKHHYVRMISNMLDSASVHHHLYRHKHFNQQESTQFLRQNLGAVVIGFKIPISHEQHHWNRFLKYCCYFQMYSSWCLSPLSQNNRIETKSFKYIATNETIFCPTLESFSTKILRAGWSLVDVQLFQFQRPYKWWDPKGLE